MKDAMPLRLAMTLFRGALYVGALVLVVRYVFR